MIYEIVCNQTGERYIGSTFEPTLARRMTCHRKKNGNACMSKQIIDRDNYYYNLLEKVDITTRDELRMAERKWYDTLDCINKVRPYVTKEERLQDMKNYHYANKDELNKKRRERFKKKSISIVEINI